MTTEILQCDMAYSKYQIHTVLQATIVKDYYKSHSVHPAKNLRNLRICLRRTNRGQNRKVWRDAIGTSHSRIQLHSVFSSHFISHNPEKKLALRKTEKKNPRAKKINKHYNIN